MKKFSNGARSSRSNSSISNFRRDQTQAYQTPVLPRMQLLDFPQQVLHNILFFVPCNSFRDMTKVKVVCKTFKNVIEEEVFFKEVDLFPMADQDWDVPLPQLTEFRLRCLELGNAFTIFMRGMWEYFCNGQLEEGLEAIIVAAEKNYDLAIYTYAMIQRIMTHHSVSDSPLINNLSRDFYTQTQRKIDEADNGFACGVEAPPLFQEKID